MLDTKITDTDDPLCSQCEKYFYTDLIMSR